MIHDYLAKLTVITAVKLAEIVLISFNGGQMRSTAFLITFTKN